MCREAVIRNHATESVCESIAKALRIPHRHCDLNWAQREALGVPLPGQVRLRATWEKWPSEKAETAVAEAEVVLSRIRERRWMNRIVALNCWPLLFVCGANHVESFRALLKARGIVVDVAHRDWVPQA